jgi:hypothetical protein
VSFNDVTAGPDKVVIPLTVTGTSGVGEPRRATGPRIGHGVVHGELVDRRALASLRISFGDCRPDGHGGRRHTHKTVTGVVDHVSNNTLSLKEQTAIGAGVYWVLNGNASGPTPAPSSPYTIKGADPGTGAAQFGNLFNAAGITNANQQSLTPDGLLSTATVNRTYTLKATLVLDLRSPISGADCNTSAVASAFPQYSELPAACPFTHVNPDGSSALIQQLPTNTDRTLLRTGAAGPLISAGFPVSSPVNVNGMVGYLAVHLSGTLSMQPKVAGAMDHPRSAANGATARATSLSTRSSGCS